MLALSLVAGCGEDASRTSAPGPVPGVAVPNGFGVGPDGLLAPGAAEYLRSLACAATSPRTESLPAVLQLVVDVSGSMNQSTPTTFGLTKWVVTRDALEAAVAALPSSTALGLLLFPNRTTSPSTTARAPSECLRVDARVPVRALGAADSPQRKLLSDSLLLATVDGNTPTHDAYTYALNQGLRASTLPGARAMLLVTDGAPTLSLGCIGLGTVSAPAPTAPIIEAIARARALGVRTFVIGSPGSEATVETGIDARPWLSAAARAGGTGAFDCTDEPHDFCHVDLTQSRDFSAALRQALQQIAREVVECSFELPPAPDDDPVDRVRVSVIYRDPSGDVLLRDEEQEHCEEGYRTEGDQVVLCSRTCQALQSDAAASIELLRHCGSTARPR